MFFSFFSPDITNYKIPEEKNNSSPDPRSYNKSCFSHRFAMPQNSEGLIENGQKQQFRSILER